MNLNCHQTRRQRPFSARTIVVLLLGSLAVASGMKVTAQETANKPADAKPNTEIYQTFYLNSVSQTNDALDIQTALRNMLPHARIFYVSSQTAISVRTNPEEMQEAQKIISDLDRPKKVYRLTYTVADFDGGKPTGAQHYTILLLSGGKSTLKLGSRMPVVTGASESGSTGQIPQVQYMDIGMGIEASLEGSGDGLRLRTKIEQTGASDEKSGLGAQDPLIHQNVLESTSTLSQGKPLVLGSIDVPGTTHHQEISVVSEVLR